MFTYVIVAVAGVIAAVSIKKYSPEIALVISIATGVLLLLGFVAEFSVVKVYLDTLTGAASLATEEIRILLRITGITIVTRVAAELCRDAGENAVAVKLELLGAVVCVVMSLPLFTEVFRLALSLL